MELAEEILTRALQRPVDGVRVIGVDGGAGGGKSTLARRLAELSGAGLVEIDDFISWDDLAGWWPRFDAQVLSPLLAGQDAHYQVRDWANDWRGGSLGGWKTLPWQPIVVIEGVTCTRRAADGRLAYKIFVDAPAELRLTRGLARDHGQDFDVTALWERWLGEEAEFFAADGTRERADAVVDTSTEPASARFNR
jgi:uridine kinase